MFLTWILTQRRLEGRYQRFGRILYFLYLQGWTATWRGLVPEQIVEVSYSRSEGMEAVSCQHRVPPKRCYLPTFRHDVAAHYAHVDIFTAVRTSNLMHLTGSGLGGGFRAVMSNCYQCVCYVNINQIYVVFFAVRTLCPSDVSHRPLHALASVRHRWATTASTVSPSGDMLQKSGSSRLLHLFPRSSERVQSVLQYAWRAAVHQRHGNMYPLHMLSRKAFFIFIYMMQRFPNFKSFWLCNMFHELHAPSTWINSNKRIWHKVQVMYNIIF
jgi:hypothetical protein